MLACGTHRKLSVERFGLRGSLESVGRDGEAAATYEAAWKLAPNDSELLGKVGVYRLLAGDTDEAIRLLSRRAKLALSDGDCGGTIRQRWRSGCRRRSGEGEGEIWAGEEERARG
jgi:hypothetical protein